MVEIRRIGIEDSIPIRHIVLWPDEPIEFCRVPEDDKGEHFGGFVAGNLVCVASLFDDGMGGMRLRKFATLAAMQGQGIGTAMLRHLIAQLRERGVRRFWCDARCSVTAFYERFGMRADAPPTQRKGVMFVQMSVDLFA